MASRGNNTLYWKNPKFSFSIPNQSNEWTAFYIQANNFLEALSINAKEEDLSPNGLKQLKMMFKGEDQQALQTLIKTSTITWENQKTPRRLSMPLPLKSSLKSTFGTSEMSPSQMCDSSQIREFMQVQGSPPFSTTVSSPTRRWRRPSRSCYSSMQWGTTRLMTGFAKMSSSLPTRHTNCSKTQCV